MKKDELCKSCGGEIMQYLALAFFVLMFISTTVISVIQIYRNVKKCICERNRMKEINNITVQQCISNINYCRLENNFDIIQDEEKIKIENTGRNLCSSKDLTSIRYVDYCKNVKI